MSVLEVFQSSFSLGLKRHTRSTGLLLVALAAPIAAHYMVPDQEATYAVLTINGQVPILTAPVLGLELGVLAATLLTPLAYIFLRAGPTRKRPWQVMDVTPNPKAIWTLGRWASDTCALWVLLTALTCAGLILGIFRLDSEAYPVQTIVALWLPAAPSLALVAAIRLLLDARPLTRGWLGDVIFFFAWIGLMVTGIVGSVDPVTDQMRHSPMTDAFGFTSPIIGAVDYPVDSVSIGGADNTGQTALIDAWRGVTDGHYFFARLLWLAVAASLAMLAGLVWSPMKAKRPKTGAAKPKRAGTIPEDIDPISLSTRTGSVAKAHHYGTAVFSEVKLMFRSKIWMLALIAAAISGLFLPFRTAAAPAVFLILIFPLTDASARWQSRSTQQLLDTLGPDRIIRAAILLLASILVAAAAITPSTTRAILDNNLQWLPHIVGIALLLPTLIVALGAITRSAVTGRLIMLITWYIYLSAAS